MLQSVREVLVSIHTKFELSRCLVCPTIEIYIYSIPLMESLGMPRREDSSSLVVEVEVGEKGGFQEGIGSEVITGLDAVGLYPSIKKSLAMRICREVAEETKVDIEHMNLLEATRLLVLTWPKDRIESCDIREYLPVRRVEDGKKVGKLGLTTLNSLGAKPNDQSHQK